MVVVVVVVCSSSLGLLVVVKRLSFLVTRLFVVPIVPIEFLRLTFVPTDDSHRFDLHARWIPCPRLTTTTATPEMSWNLLYEMMMMMMMMTSSFSCLDGGGPSLWME